MTPFKSTSGLTSRGVRKVASTTTSLASDAAPAESGLTSKGLRRAAGAPPSTQQRKESPHLPRRKG